MKVSELSALIRKIVAEEVKKQLPAVLSEMYVKRIVSENMKVSSGKRALSEEIEIEYDEPQEIRPVQKKIVSKEQLREKIKRTVLEDPEQNPLASLYEGVAIPDEDSGSDGIPLDRIPGFGGASFDKFIREDETKAPIKETKSMIERRIEQQRSKLDSLKIG